MSEITEELIMLGRELMYQDVTPELLATWSKIVDLKPDLYEKPEKPERRHEIVEQETESQIANRGGDRTNCACVRCKQFKMACGNERPCKRCVRANLADECIDCVQKRPGRKPRQDKFTKELALISVPRQFTFDEGVQLTMRFDPFANAALTIMKNLESTFVTMLMQDSGLNSAACSSFSEWLTAVEGVPSAPCILRSVFGFCVQWLSGLRKFCSEHEVGLRAKFFSFLCRDFIYRAPLYCVDDSAIENACNLLCIARTIPSYSEIDQSCQWLENISALLTHAPMGVMGIRYKSGKVTGVFVNERIQEIFQYTREEFFHIMLSDSEDISMRLWHISEWGPQFSQWLATVIGMRPHYSKKGTFIRSDGSRFEGVWSAQFTYDADLLPETILIYITPC